MSDSYRMLPPPPNVNVLSAAYRGVLRRRLSAGTADDLSVTDGSRRVAGAQPSAQLRGLLTDADRQTPKGLTAV